METATLGELLIRRDAEDTLKGATLVLSAIDSWPVDGRLTAQGWRDDGVAPPSNADVADKWLDEEGNPRRIRLLDATTLPAGMRLIRTFQLPVTSGADGDQQDEDERDSTRTWSWFEKPRGADNEGSLSASQPVLLEVHRADVEREARGIVSRLGLAPEVQQAIVLAARLHDDGKRRRVWQRVAGNVDEELVLAKSGRGMRPIDGLSAYRHELGSTLDAERGELVPLAPEYRELALHLISAHHGRARPHFPEDELFDPERVGHDFEAEGIRILQRFARLQRRYGRWGLAYLESLVRAADYAASANPSSTLELGR